ncbi:MAG TPA: PfkB family carbohydrate kinase [Solirubrobacteraceae bacterium]|nr:PfkB family carbohydrate kinase [Solirubrobacteraceae bacterium]
MSVDIACGELAFVDLTFPGLDALPASGEERHSRDFLRSPGGAAITAIGAARLGLSAALVSPVGADADGDFLRARLAADGVRWAGRTVARTAVTAVLPTDGDRALATFDPGEQVTAAELAAVAPRAAILSLPRLGVAPSGARLYATAGDAEARAGLPSLEGVHALLVNEREAQLLTGAADAHAAARRLGELVPRAIVTLGPAGALELSGGELVGVGAIATGPAVDTTGAGDLFAAAYVWADLHGAPALERLQWAVLYAGLSVHVATAVAGAATLDALVEAGARHGLASVPIEEEVQ